MSANECNPLSLAHKVMTTPLALQEPLHKEFLKLSPGDKLRCMAELAACKAAKRGEIVS